MRVLHTIYSRRKKQQGIKTLMHPLLEMEMDLETQLNLRIARSKFKHPMYSLRILYVSQG